ncbi:MAG: substrate-binding domain-containing protein [Clostridia bacterium]|nr:substrate-binding domain-containing protein [Clostridia bacterium]
MKKQISKTMKVVLVILAIILFVAIYFSVMKYYTNSQKSNEPIQEEISHEKLYDLATFPKIDASLATQPLTNAIVKDFTGGEDFDETILNYSNTHPGYVKLINDEVDLIVVTEPSEEELALAKQKGVELEVIPVVKEAFVFYVNSKNQVDNLTTEQIQKIYTGEIKNWKEVGGQDEEIKAYQRPVNSGSQTGMLSLVMKGLKLMEAPKENLIGSMEEIVNMVSSYQNGKNAIGYSYYYYATTMFETIDQTVASNIKLLGIDGVKPNNQTIKDSSYPFTTAYYIVINKADPEDAPSRILANQLLSERGQKVAEDAGYVPVK